MDYDALERQLDRLRSEHRQLDHDIKQYAEIATFNQLEIQRMKRRKLAIKDEMSRIEDILYPDIIA